MTAHEQYKLAFSVLQTESTPAQVLQRKAASKGVTAMKKRTIWILAAAVFVLLLGTAAACELHSHWLSGMLTNIDDHPEVAERVENVNVSQTVDGTTWTIEDVLTEGRTVFWTLTKTRTDGQPFRLEEEAQESVHLVLLDRNGADLNVGYSVTTRQLDDGSDPTTCKLLYMAEITGTGAFGDDYEGGTLYLAHTREGEPVRIDGILQTPNVTMVSVETEIKPYPLRETVTQNGVGLNVGRVSVELQGIRLLGKDFEEAAAATMGNSCFLVLKDGRELPVSFSLMLDTGVPEDEQWQGGTLPEIIDPQEAVAFRVGDTIYPLTDK